MQRLLIIGCGDVMRRALPFLVRHWRVYALVRDLDTELTPRRVRQIQGDLDAPHTLRRLAGLADAVIHSAPPPDQGATDTRTRHLLAALRGKARWHGTRLHGRPSLPRRMVYISTSGVYGDCAGEPVAETRPPRPQSARGTRRLDAERQLRAFGRHGHCRISLLRAPGIYAANRLPLARLHKGLPVLRDEEDVYTNHIHAEDLARACLAALRFGRPNRCYNVSDDSALRMGQWFSMLAAAFGLPPPPKVSRVEAALQLSPMQMSFMNESRRLDNRRLKRELLVTLRYPDVAAGIAAAQASLPASLPPES